MRHKYVLRLCRNFLDLNSRQVLAVPYGALILLLALELKDNSLNAATVRQNGPCHARALGGRAGLHALAVHHCKHSPELDFGAGFPSERFHFNGLSWSDAVLFPACLDYCVHGSSSSRFSCWLNLAPGSISLRAAKGRNSRILQLPRPSSADAPRVKLLAVHRVWPASLFPSPPAREAGRGLS